jgi:hypothetical protein
MDDRREMDGGADMCVVFRLIIDLVECPELKMRTTAPVISLVRHGEAYASPFLTPGRIGTGHTRNQRVGIEESQGLAKLAFYVSLEFFSSYWERFE